VKRAPLRVTVIVPTKALPRAPFGPACLALGILSAGLMLLGPARRVQPSPAHAAEAGPGMAR
jgi:hypothetical protein